MIIGVAGNLGSGKGEVTKYLKSLNYNEIFFAKNLKDICSIIGNYDDSLNYTQNGKNHFLEHLNLSIGELMQKVGQGLRDKICDNLWVNLTLNDINHNLNYVISDCRYHNEMDEIKKLGGILIKIVRPDNETLKNSLRDINHPSETELNSYNRYDHIIINDGTIENLFEKIKQII